MTTGDKSLSPSASQCRHHYFGFCKTKEKTCPHGEHLDLTCQQGPACGDTYCKQVKRHPRYCKFYTSGGFCSHGKNCSYIHVNFLNLIQELKSEVDNLKNVQRESSERTGKPKVKSQNPLQPSPGYPCKACPKICLSSSGLKRHIQIKHAGVELLQKPVKPKPDGSMESKEDDEPKKESQVPIPKSKAELALIIEQKLRSAYSKPPETELDENPRRKYVIDLTTNKKYVYDNLQRGEFAFREEGGLSFTIFFSEYYGSIPQAELGLPTADFDYNNKIYYSNVEYLESLPQEADQDADHDGVQDADHEDEPDNEQEADDGHDTSQESSQDHSHEDFDIQDQDHTINYRDQHQEDPDHYFSDNSDQDISQDSQDMSQDSDDEYYSDNE